MKFEDELRMDKNFREQVEKIKGGGNILLLMPDE
jgi:hypothetical protein